MRSLEREPRIHHTETGKSSFSHVCVIPLHLQPATCAHTHARHRTPLQPVCIRTCDNVWAVCTGRTLRGKSETDVGRNNLTDTCENAVAISKDNRDGTGWTIGKIVGQQLRGIIRRVRLRFIASRRSLGHACNPTAASNKSASRSERMFVRLNIANQILRWSRGCATHCSNAVICN